MGFINPSLDEIKTILQNCKHIAVVGLSPKHQRPSHMVASNLQSFGYHIIPVRPAVDEVLGERLKGSDPFNSVCSFPLCLTIELTGSNLLKKF